MAHLVATTMGSWGDLFPAIGLAKEAAARGHSVTIAATPAYTELLEAEHLQVTPVGPRLGPEEFAAEPAILDGGQGGFAGFLHLFRTFVFPNLGQWTEELRRAVDGADLLLAHPAVLAAPIAAELAGVPWATFSLFPGLIPSAHTLPSPTRAPLPAGAPGRALRRSAWAAARWNIARHFDPAVNGTRASFGLPPIRDALFLPVDSGRPYLVGTSPHLVETPPTGRATSGSPVSSPGTRRSRCPRRRSSGHSSTPGHRPYSSPSAAAPPSTHRTSIRTRSQPFAGWATARLSSAARRPLPSCSSPTHTCSCRDAPLTTVAPRCTAALHHGGIGTTVGILAAGLPQLIVPRSFDQPQTAQRMQRLGVARTVPWRRATTASLENGLARILNDPHYRKRARQLADEIRTEDGLQRAVDTLEQHVT